MTHRIALLPGDGAGQEVLPEAVKVIRATGTDIEFEEFEVGGSRVLRGEPALPDDVFAAAAAADSILFGAVGDPRVPDVGYPAQVLLRMRFELDLYANLRPARLYDPRLSPLKDDAFREVDLLVIRENTEGIYVGMGGRFKRGTPEEVAVQEDVNTRLGVERIVALGFEEARRDLCLVDKSNAMQHAGGLWQDVWNDAQARLTTAATTRHLYADAAAMELVRDPSQFDVIVTNNLFGDILSDLCAQLIGGMGVAPSANINPQTRAGLFEPVHGSAPKIAGQGIVNPIGAVLSGAMMLGHLGLAREADAIEAAVRAAIREGECTRDLGGTLSTAEAGDAIARRV
ncbi:MAG TPA: isocitrate/isopropylmalate dehydrogenase family protein [Solirubrobacterales bacterium]|nr:isocitrate/isopropylmalate dehydrogenase family protein [Solirubrobacterales bacterium]